MLRSGTILMIREKAESGESAYAIGKELRISKNTAHKYIECKEDAPPKIDLFSKLDAYKPQLDELMNQGIFNCVVLQERLQSAGYSGGISILKEYVHPYRPAKALPAVRCYGHRQASRRRLRNKSCGSRCSQIIVTSFGIQGLTCV